MLWLTVWQSRAYRKRKTTVDPGNRRGQGRCGWPPACRGSGMGRRLDRARQHHRGHPDEQHGGAGEHQSSAPGEPHARPPGRRTRMCRMSRNGSAARPRAAHPYWPSRLEARVYHLPVVGHQPEVAGAGRPGIRLRPSVSRIPWALISNRPRLAAPLCYRRGHVRLPDQTLIRWYASSIV